MVCWPFLVQALYWVHSLSLLCMADCLAYFLCREWLWAPQGPYLALAGISRMCLKMLLCSLVDNLVISVQEISINNSYQFIFHLTEGPAVRPSAEGLCRSAGLCLQGTAHRFYHTHFISDTFRESPHSVEAFFKDWFSMVQAAGGLCYFDSLSQIMRDDLTPHLITNSPCLLLPPTLGWPLRHPAFSVWDTHQSLIFWDSTAGSSVCLLLTPDGTSGTMTLFWLSQWACIWPSYLHSYLL